MRLEEVDPTENLTITLPAIVYGPIKYSIGVAFQLLRDVQKLKVIKKGDIKISPRKKAKCLMLENHETIVIVSGKKIERPENVDGVIQKDTNGKYTWQSHSLIDYVRSQINSTSFSEYASHIAASWEDQLKYRREKNPVRSEEDYGLRPPQIGALHAIGSHWSLNNSPATIVMPTGTGKTETMLAVQVAHQINKLLVAVPSKALRSQIGSKFRRFGILRNLNVLPKEIKFPIVGIVYKRPKEQDDLKLFKDCNVTIGVVSSLSGGTASNYLREVSEICSTLIIDEAHHVAAKTWDDLKSAFRGKPVLQFTATPFRNDGKLVGGSVIYNYPLKQAQSDGYFKSIDFIPVYDIDYTDADLKIAEEAVGKLRIDLGEGKPHQLMARCKTKERAEEIITIYHNIAPDLKPILIHSEITDNDDRISKLRSGESKIVVCVNMLGEGVDIPSLKIAAIHDMHKSLAILLQFVGRFTRTGEGNLGDAKIVANIANPKVSGALEALYSEDADWNILLREMSSQAAKRHSEFISFLENSTRYEVGDGTHVEISQNSLKPTFSTLFFECETFSPQQFINGLGDRFNLVSVWINDESNTLYFVTRSTEKAKWTKSKEVEHVDWDLFVIHHNPDLKLLYLASTNKSSSHSSLAKSVGATEQLEGEEMFRSLGHIGRLVFNNLGVTKHGRRNLSFAMYTGADVKQALSETEKRGSRKSNISGYGWEDGVQITIGCSYRGRVWSKAAGTIPEFIEWADKIGEKLLDTSIDTKSVIANVLIPEYADILPEFDPLTIEWPIEILVQSEDRVSIQASNEDFSISEIDIRIDGMDRENSTIVFEIISQDDTPIDRFKLIIAGQEGFEISSGNETPSILTIGSKEYDLVEFFNDYPPLIRFMDLSELDGNIILRAEDSGYVNVSDQRLIPWNWSDTDITLESIWKNGIKRENTIQEKTANKFIDAGFSVVYDDDDKGEAADLICLKEEEDYIRLALIHCKFSGSDEPGKRIKDVIEVSSQAIRSARWPGKFKNLITHIQKREKRHDGSERDGFLAGDMSGLSYFLRLNRFKEIKPEILIVQPGIQKSNHSAEQSVILGAAVSFVKQTLGIDVDIICSD